jgi:hypothetical protein
VIGLFALPICFRLCLVAVAEKMLKKSTSLIGSKRQKTRLVDVSIVVGDYLGCTGTD